jgi:CRISPR system Cascade subunit CasB
MTQAVQTHPFIEYLQSLMEDRGALAALRRGLGQKPGLAPEMYPYVIPRLPAHLNTYQESAYFLTASLFAFHPQSTQYGNLGAHLAATITNEANRPPVERRFIALLSAHTDDLGKLLRHTISYLKSKEQPVNWRQLLLDLLAWDHPDRYVQKKWARAFWGRQESEPQAETTTNPE